MGEAVQESGGEGLIKKELSPLGKRQIGSDDEGDAVIDSGAKLKEQLSALSGEGDEAEFI